MTFFLSMTINNITMKKANTSLLRYKETYSYVTVEGYDPPDNKIRFEKLNNDRPITKCNVSLQDEMKNVIGIEVMSVNIPNPLLDVSRLNRILILLALKNGIDTKTSNVAPLQSFDIILCRLEDGEYYADELIDNLNNSLQTNTTWLSISSAEKAPFFHKHPVESNDPIQHKLRLYNRDPSISLFLPNQEDVASILSSLHYEGVIYTTLGFHLDNNRHSLQ